MGGLIQMVAYGAQDVILTGNPKMTFFKSVFRSYTNFSIESKKLNIEGNITALENSFDCIISRNGDLLSGLWMEINIPSVLNNNNTATFTHWCNNTGAAFVKQCEIDIGGQMIEKHDSLWYDIYNELNNTDIHANKQINKNKSLIYRHNGNKQRAPNLHLMIPLHFWFTKNKGSSLPLIALQYHEVTLKIVTRAIRNLLITDADNSNIVFQPANIEIWADYVFLDTPERKRFAQSKHTYLVEQVQLHTANIVNRSQNIEIMFSHPVKQLVWVFTNTNRTQEINTSNIAANPSLFRSKRLQDNGTTLLANGYTESVRPGNDYFNYMPTSTAGNTSVVTAPVSGSSINGDNTMENFDNVVLKLNGHHRFEARRAVYFRTIQPVQSYLQVPSKHIYVYSFSLNPKEYQPSGSCNFSRLDSAELEFNNLGEITNKQLSVYAINYNILHIASGMGGIAFAH